MQRVVTWGDDRGNTVDITPKQEAMFQAAGKWPKNGYGVEYCTVKHGLHRGKPTWTDEQVAEMCEG